MDPNKIFVKPINEVPLLQMPEFKPQAPLFPKLFTTASPTDGKLFSPHIATPQQDGSNNPNLKPATPLFGNFSLFSRSSQGFSFNSKPTQNQPPKDSSSSDQSKKNFSFNFSSGIFNKPNTTDKQQSKVTQIAQDPRKPQKSQGIFGAKVGIFSVPEQKKKSQFNFSNLSNSQKSDQNSSKGPDGSVPVDKKPTTEFQIKKPLFGLPTAGSQNNQQLFSFPNKPPQEKKEIVSQPNPIFSIPAKKQQPAPQPSIFTAPIAPTAPIAQQVEKKQISQTPKNPSLSSQSTPQFKPSIPISFGNKQGFQKKDAVQPIKQVNNASGLPPKQQLKPSSIFIQSFFPKVVQADKNLVNPKKQATQTMPSFVKPGAQTKSEQKSVYSLNSLYKPQYASQPVNLQQKRNELIQKPQGSIESSESSFKRIDIINNKNLNQQPLGEIPQQSQVQSQDKKQGQQKNKPINLLGASTTLNKPTLPSHLKRTDTLDIIQNQKSTLKGRGRGRITNITQEQIQEQNQISNQTKKPIQDYIQLQKLHTQSFEIQQDRHWQIIYNSFKKYLSFDRGIRGTGYKFQNIFKNQDLNKFINDFTMVIGNFLQFPQSSFKAFANLFYFMIKDSGYQQVIFIEGKFRTQLIDRIYFRESQNQFVLKWQEPDCAKLICQFISYYSSCISVCLKKVEQNLKIIKNKSLFELLLQVNLSINLRQLTLEHPDIKQVLKANDKRQINHLNRILKELLNQRNSFRDQAISIDKMIQLIPLVDQLPVCQLSKIYQKFLLKAFNYKNIKDKSNQRIIDHISKTRNILFMPFRAIANRINSNKQQINPYLKDLFQQIDGPEWSDWLSVYLGQDNIRLKQRQTHYLINALKKMKINNINKILSSQIKRLIYIMMQEQQTKNFYEALSYIIYDNNSIQAVQNQFFSKNDKLFQDFRVLAKEMSQYPECIFSQEDIIPIIGKSTYFLTTLALCPNKALKYENIMFDNLGFIEESGQRCDRVCHLVLDILSYFSVVLFNDELISKCFEVIISLLQNNQTRQCMSLALNVNIPSFDFFNKHLSKLVLEKMYFFITHLISSEKFLDSTRVSEQSSRPLKAYPLRYNIQKYLQQVKRIKYSIPMTWLASCLKMTVKQRYNPQFLQIILSKLRIYASKESVLQSPIILSSIVQGCNSSNFFKQLKRSLQAQIFQQKGRCVIFNNQLHENSEGQSILTVFYSLKLLKLLISLRNIRNKAQKESPKHYLSQLLSSLNCLNQLDKYYFYGTSQFQITTTKTIPPVLSLFALTLQFSPLINSSDNFKTEWVYIEGVSINYDNLKKFHQEIAKQIDYSVLRDPLVHPYYPNLQCYENISSLAYDCLSQILIQQKQVSIQTLIFLIVSKKREVYKQQDIQSIKNQIMKQFGKNLDNNSVKISRSTWNLLNVMRNTTQNKRLSRQIFKKYYETKPNINNIKKIKPVVQFLRQEIKDGVFQYSSLIEKILGFVSNVQSDNIMDLIQTYRSKSIYLGSVHQFDRLIHERKMLNAYEYYQIMCLIGQIVLHELFNKSRPTTLLRHSSLLVNTIAKSDILDIFYLKSRLNLQFNQIHQQICNENSPRLYGPDVLQMFISNSTRTREYLIDIQINNVLNWFNYKIRGMNQKITNFLSVMLSIDQTYYANHPIQFKTKYQSQLFCQLHLGIIGYKAVGLFGDTERQSIINVKLIIDSLLQKIKSLISKIKQSQISQQITRTYNLIDLAVNWLRSCKKVDEGELNTCCQKVITASFSKLGDSITHMSTAKLLLTCVNILKSNLNKDIMGNLKQTVMKTLSSDEIDINLKQQLLSVFLIAVPTLQQTHILQKIANLWCNQINNEHFYNQSRIMYKLCSVYPIQMARLKIISKCQRIVRCQEGSHYFIDNQQVFRTAQTKSWIWILKIVSALMENGQHSTLVVNQVSKFVTISKKKIISVLNQFKQGGEKTLKNKSKNSPFKLTLAKLDQLEATLQLFIVLAQCKMWVQMNRQLFEQLFYYIMNKTIVIFKNSCMYRPNSAKQKQMQKINPRNSINENLSQSYGSDSQIIEQNFRMYSNKSANVFSFVMSLRFNDCLKLWLLSCSTGMRNSCFVREYFFQPIKGTNFKYISTHWDQIYKSLLIIVQDLLRKAKFWCSQQNDKLINLTNDCLNSAQFFTETGYLYSIIKFAQNQDELVSEIGEAFSLVFEMGACHLVSQIYYQNRNKTFSKQYLQGLQLRLINQCKKAEQQINKLYRDKTLIGENPVLRHMQSSKKMLQQIQK